MSALPVEADASGRLDSTGAVVGGQAQVAEEGPSASFHRRGPRRPPPKPPPGIGCAGEARARTGPFNTGPCESSSLARLPTWKGSAFKRRLCRRNESWGEVSEGGRSPPPSGTYREYASRAAVGCRLAAGPFSSL